jgi:RND family efflux transporter MFP subunit
MTHRSRTHFFIRGASFCALFLHAIALPAQETTYDCVIEPRSTIELGTPDEGILAALLVERGDVVKQGQLVARLNDNAERMQAERARIRAESDVDVRSNRAEADFRLGEENRIADLHADKLVPDREYEQARIERRLAELAVQSAEIEYEVAKVEHQQAQEKLARRSIESPVNGVVVSITMSPGEYVHKQATVMTIAEIDPLNVEVFVPVDQYGTISAGTKADVVPDEPVGGVYTASVAVADKVFDAASRTFGIRLILPNPGFVLPAGVRCEVRFRKDDDPDVAKEDS